MYTDYIVYREVARYLMMNVRQFDDNGYDILTEGVANSFHDINYK